MTVTKVDQINDILQFLEIGRNELPGWMDGLPGIRLKVLDEFMKKVADKLKSADDVEVLKLGLIEAKKRLIAQN